MKTTTKGVSVTSNQAALLAVIQPKHQSGQASIGQIYEAARTLRKGGNRVLIAWVPSQGGFELGRKAREAAWRATEQGRSPRGQSHRAKSTTINFARAEQRRKKALREGVGRDSREIDTTLEGLVTILLDSCIFGVGNARRSALGNKTNVTCRNKREMIQQIEENVVQRIS